MEYSEQHGGTFRGNACINLVGKPEDIREFIDKNNLNPYVRKGTVLAIEGAEETPVYPESDEHLSYK